MSEEANQPVAEQPAEQPAEKTYEPPHPTIKECIQLNQLLPIIDIDKNIDAISSAIYDNDDLLNEFLQKVDNRIKVCNDDPKGPFIMCEQNRDGDSYRSPISNQFFPPENDVKFPSADLRELEIKLNKMFKVYSKMYYSTHAISSAYCWELADDIKDGFGVAILFKNALDNEKKIKKGSWDSSNLITVTFEEDGKKAKYNLITTVNLSMAFDHPVVGKVSLSGTVARSSHYTKPIKDYVKDDAHIENIGVLVEDMESGIRNVLDTIYCMKSKEIIDTARFNPTEGKPNIQGAQRLKEAWKGGVPAK